MAQRTADGLHRQVRAMAHKGAVPHAVILSGAGDRSDAARYLAAAMLCRSDGDKPCLHCAACRKVLSGIHPDVRTVQDAERKELAVDLIREVRQDAYIRPNEGERKVYIFADCGQLNERDQNVLLKIVEEGPPYAAFIFCTDAAAALLPTIRSRCVELKLRGAEEPVTDDRALALCRGFAGGEVLPVAEYLVGLENKRLKREQLQPLLQEAWRLCADALLVGCGKKATPGQAGEVSALLGRSLSRAQLQKLTDCLGYYAAQCSYNVGPGHVLGALLADWEAMLRRGA